MAVTLAIDVYGTLIDTHGVVAELRDLIGADAAEFSRTWRDKQLEYSFRRGLMQNYENFAVCTSQALEYTCVQFKVALTTDRRNALLAAYRTLPPFPDVKPALQRLQSSGFKVYAFSNGSAEAVATLLEAADLTRFFRGVVSVDDVRSFKPNPAVYCHFLRQSSATGAQAWLISGNPFDVIGAVSAGMKAAWIKRSPDAVFDPWGIEPTVTVKSLQEFSDLMVAGSV